MCLPHHYHSNITNHYIRPHPPTPQSLSSCRYSFSRFSQNAVGIFSICSNLEAISAVTGSLPLIKPCSFSSDIFIFCASTAGCIPIKSRCSFSVSPGGEMNDFVSFLSLSISISSYPAANCDHISNKFKTPLSLSLSQSVLNNSRSNHTSYPNPPKFFLIFASSSALSSN